jgi:FkbM family methyltransferase
MINFIKKPLRALLKRPNAYKWVEFFGLYRVKWFRRAVVFHQPIQIKATDLRIFPSQSQSFNDLYYLGIDNQKDSFTLHIVRKLSKISKVLWDIGAYVGIDSLVAVCSNEKLKVVSFEPNPKNFEMLTQNILLNPKYSTNIQPVPFALSNSNGEDFFYLDKNKPQGGGLDYVEDFEEVKVDVYNGTFLVREKGILAPDFIKIDVEGHEAKVIEGLLPLLSPNTVFVLEVLSEEYGRMIQEVLPPEFEYYGIIEEDRALVKKEKLIRLSKRSKNYLILHQSIAEKILIGLR